MRRAVWLVLVLAGCPGGTGANPVGVGGGGGPNGYAVATAGLCGMQHGQMRAQCERDNARMEYRMAQQQAYQRQDQMIGEQRHYEMDQANQARYREARLRCEPMAVNTTRCQIYKPEAIGQVIESCAASLLNADRVYGMTVCMINAQSCDEMRQCMGLPPAS